MLEGDAADAVAVKEKPGEDLHIMGSGELIQSLMRRALIDEYMLMIHPLVLRTGRRLFTDGSPATNLRLIDSKPTPAGVVIATYQPVEQAAVWRRSLPRDLGAFSGARSATPPILRGVPHRSVPLHCAARRLDRVTVEP